MNTLHELAHTPDFSTQSIWQKRSSHHRPECWNGNSSPTLCLVIIFPPGLLYKSAQISLSVTSVNNGNKERTRLCRCVPLRQSTCHQVAWPVPPHPLSSSYWPFAGAQIRRLSAMGSGESGAGEDQRWIPLTQPAPPTIAASDSFA